MPIISTVLRRFVIERAENRCEYCKLAQIGQEATFHIDHIIPLAAAGETSADNLALACVSCSLRKAARQEAEDPTTGNIEKLFHPRQQNWDQHFAWEEVQIARLTPVGRATVAALLMNRPLILAIRAEEALLGRHPPS